MEYLCSIRIEVFGWSSVKIKNQLVRAIESSSNIRQFHFELVRYGGFQRPRFYHKTKKEVIEVFINRIVKQCYKEFARIHGIEKKKTPKTTKYKEKKGSFIEEFLLNLPGDIAGALAVYFLTSLASKLKKEFEKLIKEKPPKKGKDNNSKGGEQPPKENEASTTVQVNIGELSDGNVNIIITK